MLRISGKNQVYFIAEVVFAGEPRSAGPALQDRWMRDPTARMQARQSHPKEV
jgi:hypothetical protein